MNRNYQKELDRIIQKRGQKTPRVLLHSCCGPCSSAVLEYITQYFDVTLLWYNPNLYPKQYCYDYCCTTLTLSRHKDAVLINTIGEEIAKAVGVSWLPSDFKKRNGENRSIELSEQYGLYRQLYCGCEFSLHHRQAVAEE